MLNENFPFIPSFDLLFWHPEIVFIIYLFFMFFPFNTGIWPADFDNFIFITIMNEIYAPTLCFINNCLIRKLAKLQRRETNLSYNYIKYYIVFKYKKYTINLKVYFHVKIYCQDSFLIKKMITWFINPSPVNKLLVSV